jgi:flagellar secretion chaperone FliS
MVAKGYAQAYRAAAVLTASPGQLVLMLFDGALKSMAMARDAFGRPPSDFRRIEAIHRHLTKAQSILAELQGGLDMKAGGEFAETMHRLYDYHMRRLFEANIRKQEQPVIEVEDLVRQIRDAWAEMLSKRDASVDIGRRIVA